MGKLHKKITLIEREEILGLLKQGKSIRDIARSLGRSPSSISTETRRNGMTRDRYSLSVAQVDRNVKASQRGRKVILCEGKQPLKQIKEWILENKWSPEQVAGRLKIKFKKMTQKNKSPTRLSINIFIHSRIKRKKRSILNHCGGKGDREGLENSLRDIEGLYPTLFPYMKGPWKLFQERFQATGKVIQLWEKNMVRLLEHL